MARQVNIIYRVENSSQASLGVFTLRVTSAVTAEKGEKMKASLIALGMVMALTGTADTKSRQVAGESNLFFTVADYTGSAQQKPLAERLTFEGSWICGEPFTVASFRHYVQNAGSIISLSNTQLGEGRIQDKGEIKFLRPEGQASGPAVYQMKLQPGTKPKWYNRTNCISQVRANLHIERDKFLATQETFMAKDLESLLSATAKGLANVAAFYVPAKSLPLTQIPHINVNTLYTVGYGCSEGAQLSGEYMAGSILASHSYNRDLRFQPVLLEEKIFLPALFWLGKGGKTILPCLDENTGSASKKDFYVTLYSGSAVGGGLYTSVGDLYSALEAQSELSTENP